MNDLKIVNEWKREVIKISKYNYTEKLINEKNMFTLVDWIIIYNSIVYRTIRLLNYSPSMLDFPVSISPVMITT